VSSIGRDDRHAIAAAVASMASEGCVASMARELHRYAIAATR